MLFGRKSLEKPVMARLIGLTGFFYGMALGIQNDRSRMTDVCFIGHRLPVIKKYRTIIMH
jgi:hypothetical protein